MGCGRGRGSGAATATLEALGILDRDGELHRWNAEQAELVRNLDEYTHQLVQLETGAEDTPVSERTARRFAVRNTRALHNTLVSMGGQPALSDILSALPPSKLRLAGGGGVAVATGAALGPLPNDFQKASRVHPDELKVDAQIIDFNELALQFETWTGQDELASRMSSPRPMDVPAASKKQPLSPRRFPSRGDSRTSLENVLVSPRAVLSSEVLLSPRSSGAVSPVAAAAVAWPQASPTPEPALPVRLPQWALNPVELGQGAGEEILSDEAMLAVHDAALEQFRVKFESDLRKQPRSGAHHPRQPQRSVKASDSKRRREAAAPTTPPTATPPATMTTTTTTSAAPPEQGC